MHHKTDQLSAFEPQKEFFIGIDSDGCVFDTMEIKHKECFCPAFINHFGLQPASKYAREVWEFVNLYSHTRGINRFKAVLRALELYNERDEVALRKASVPRLEGLQAWAERETKLGNPAFEAELERDPHPDLELVYKWSCDVNRAVEKIVRNVPPFPYVHESLTTVREKADSIVVSQTPLEALEREWDEQELSGYVRLIAGQEMGRKSEHLARAAGGKYSEDHILMIGDAPGDLTAAKENNALFYPVIPGEEEESWQQFY
jgi:phosphoglycolate phosphatase-like HAD superfamily hydrolase